MGSYRAAVVGEDGNIFGDSQFVVLEPETWVGKRFPLLQYIDLQHQLAEGKWVVVLYHHDCPECRDVIPEYEQLAHRLAGRLDGLRVGLIEMAPYARDDDLGSGDGTCARGRLADVKEWFTATPVEFVLDRATVIDVATGAEGIRDPCRGKAGSMRMVPAPLGWGAP